MTTTEKDRRVLLAMSGGVDSSVAALKLTEAGYQPVGLTLKLWCHGGHKNFTTIRKRAGRVCHQLGIPHAVLDIETEFEEGVVRPFVDEYLSGRTPNPCVFCNRLIKWRHLIEYADREGISWVATGHYARLFRPRADGRFELRRARDARKDQSYALWRLRQDQLRRTLFPMGDLAKAEAVRIAREKGLIDGLPAESQDICFLPDNDYREFLASYVPQRLARIPRGELVDEQGNIVGKHAGYYHFTIGQRKGFGRGFGGRRYVKAIDAKCNRIVIAENEKLMSSRMLIEQLNWVSVVPQRELEGVVKIRYNHKGVKCRSQMREDGKMMVKFEQPQRAVTPGQSAVIYADDRVLLGGIIVKGEI